MVKYDYMLYKLLSDIVVAVHFLWIVFLIFGAFWGVRHRVVKYFHLLGLAFAVVINIFGVICPLTLLEVWADSRHDPSVTYTGSFISHYLEKLIYLDAPPWALLVLTLVVCAASGWYYISGGRIEKEPPV